MGAGRGGGGGVEGAVVGGGATTVVMMIQLLGGQARPRIMASALEGGRVAHVIASSRLQLSVVVGGASIRRTLRGLQHYYCSLLR